MSNEYHKIRSSIIIKFCGDIKAMQGRLSDIFYSLGPPPLAPLLSGFPAPTSLSLGGHHGPPGLIPPPHLEHLLKQELFNGPKPGPCLQSQPDLYPQPGHHPLPLELLARSGLFYQNFPNFAGSFQILTWFVY